MLKFNDAFRLETTFDFQAGSDKEYRPFLQPDPPGSYMSDDTSEFSFEHRVAVRFADVDVGGHAHHSRALIYFEEARAAYWREVAGPYTAEEVDYILAEATARFHARILWPDTLTVGVRMSVMGKKHFEMEYEVRSGEGEALVSGSTVQVMYDYQAGESVRIPQGIRSAVEALEGGPLPRRRNRG